MFTLIFLIVVLAIIIYYYAFKSSNKELDNIPSVSGLPLAWGLLQQKYHDEIEDIIYKSSKGHDIYLYRIGPYKCVIIMNPEYVKDLLMESAEALPKLEFPPENRLNKFFGQGIIFSNGHKWQTYRRLANSAFNKEISTEFVGETTMDLFAFMQQNLNQPIDIYGVMQRFTIELLGKLAFGYQFGCLKSEETPHIIKVYESIMSNLGSSFRLIFPLIDKLPTESNQRFINAIKEFDGFIYDIIETKRKEIYNKETSYSGHVDILTSMLEASKQEGISEDIKQLRDEMVGLFVAGHDTTAMALSTSLYFLAKHPEIQEKARAEVISIFGNEPITPTSDQLKELKYINAVIKETLRSYPPASIMTFREPSKQVKIGPYNIPANTLCLINIWQIHHDPKHWENPKQYNPERFLRGEKRHPFSWVPFSAGPRNCLGQNITLMEQRVVLSMILLKYNWTLPKNSINKDKLLLEPQFLSKPVDLKLIFTERN